MESEWGQPPPKGTPAAVQLIPFSDDRKTCQQQQRRYFAAGEISADLVTQPIYLHYRSDNCSSGV